MFVIIMRRIQMQRPCPKTRPRALAPSRQGGYALSSSYPTDGCLSTYPSRISLISLRGRAPLLPRRCFFYALPCFRRVFCDFVNPNILIPVRIHGVHPPFRSLSLDLLQGIESFRFHNEVNGNAPFETDDEVRLVVVRLAVVPITDRGRGPPG